MDSWVFRPPLGTRGVRLGVALAAVLALFALVLPGAVMASSHAKGHTSHKRAHQKKHAFKIPARGLLDCNGFSRRQHVLKHSLACTDIGGKRGISNDFVWNSRFHDNGHYIGHDEPDMTFLSSAPGSGNDVSWTETLPRDPSALPTVAHPGSDVTHWFELSIAPWFSMAMCDGNSYPQLACEPQSDFNAPSGSRYPGAGSAFMEMQFYPPGMAPFADSISCDNTHWCSALTIDSLECTVGFAHCNTACEEPVNFAFLQTNGVPAGPPSPQMANLDSSTPNAKTLLMNPGDQLSVHMSNAPVPGQAGQKAFEVVVKDLTTGQTGYMQASAKNGFQNTSITDCSGTPFNFQPEYNTAAKQNIVPWAALQTNISTQFEIGHFTPCTSLSNESKSTLGDVSYSKCNGPYETSPDSDSSPESSDAPCYPFGSTHGPLNTAPNEVTGCIDFAAGGDLDFDGTPYWADWPTSTAPTAKFPSTFIQNLPATQGRTYPQYFVQTDAALSESTCTDSGAGCAVPPPNAPGKFYPYWSRVNTPGGCRIEFGNVATGNLGGDAQYGTDQAPTLGYPEFEGPVKSNSACSA
jgi:hypothetical protein